MTSTKRAFGLRPNRNLAGGDSGALMKFRALASAAEDIGFSDPVYLVSGNVYRASGNPARVYGVAQQFIWIDPTTKQPQFKNHLPAGTSSAADQNGESFITALVYVNPHALYQVQADATLSAGDVGMSYGLSAVGSIVAATGNSQAVLKASTRSTAASAAAPYRLLGLVEFADNKWGDQFPIVEVECLLNQFVVASAS